MDYPEFNLGRTVESLIPVGENFTLSAGVKVFFILGGLIYLGFAIVIVRQVNLMTKTLNVELENLIRFIAWSHLLLVIMMMLLGIITL
jgi:hypothetical protein